MPVRFINLPSVPGSDQPYPAPWPRTVVRAGDFMYVPPGIPHLPVNRSDVMTVAVVARTDPQEQESVVTLSLPPHLAELDDFPVASP